MVPSASTTRPTSSAVDTSDMAPNQPSDRPSATPTSADTATSAREPGPVVPPILHAGHQGLHQPTGQPGLGRGPDLVGGVRTDQSLQDRTGPVPVDPGDHGLDHLLQPLVGRGVLVAHPLGGHGGDVEVGLAAEVAGDEGGVDPGPLADLPDGGGLEALLAEQVLGRGDQGLPAGGGVPRSRRSLGRFG